MTTATANLPTAATTTAVPIAAPRLESVLRTMAFAACATVAAMLALFVVRGVGQDPLQFVHTPADYLAILLRDPSGLRVVLGLDNAFIVFYATLFLMLGQLLVRRGAPRTLTIAAIGLLLATAALDMIENFHFMTMLSAAEHGLGVGAGEIGYQVTESLFKFHVGYLGLFLLGFVLPNDTRAGRLLSWASWYVQLPVGILIYVTPPAISTGLVLIRLTYFVAALIATAFVFRPAPTRG